MHLDTKKVEEKHMGWGFIYLSQLFMFPFGTQHVVTPLIVPTVLFTVGN